MEQKSSGVFDEIYNCHLRNFPLQITFSSEYASHRLNNDGATLLIVDMDCCRELAFKTI